MLDGTKVQRYNKMLIFLDRIAVYAENIN